MSTERFTLRGLSTCYRVHDGDRFLSIEEVVALLNSAAFTREEAMAKWGLIERPKVCDLIVSILHFTSTMSSDPQVLHGQLNAISYLCQHSRITEGGGMNSVEWTHKSFTCPHCGFVDVAPHVYFEQEHWSDYVDRVCVRCRQPIEVHREVRYYYIAKAKETP